MRDEFERLLETDRHAAATIVTRLVESEAVVHLDDIVLRRTDWGIDPRHGRRFGREVAELLEWTVERKERELRLLESSVTRAGGVGATY